MQQTTESTKRIDIRWLLKKNILSSNCIGSIYWTYRDEEAGSVSYSNCEDRIVLNYRYRPADSLNWERVSQTIYYEKTPCNFGGERKWFSCPNCKRRCSIIYGVAKFFLCRNCYSLPYQSQLQSKVDRLISKKHEVGQEIFENYRFGDGWKKKKGMHHKTFHSKLETYNQLERAIDVHILKILKRFDP